MKIFSASVILFFAFVGTSNAQTKSMIGTVVDVESGNRWASIVVKVGNQKYSIQTHSVAAPADPNQEVVPTPKITGRVEEVGRTVKIFYTKIVNGEVRATRIVEIKKSKR